MYRTAAVAAASNGEHWAPKPRIIVSFFLYVASQWLPYFKSHQMKPFMGDSLTRVLCILLCHFSLCQIYSATIPYGHFRRHLFMVFKWFIFQSCGECTEYVNKKIDRSIWFMAFEVMNACAQLFNVFDMCLVPYLVWRSQILCAPPTTVAIVLYLYGVDDGKSKMTKTPTQHHTIIIIIAYRDL